MTIITRYSFGMMEVDSDVYRTDLIILPDGSIHHPWWRSEGHVLRVADIRVILAAKPSYLVVGTGNSGMMKLDKEFKTTVEAEGIQVIILPTEQAVGEFNQMSAQAGSIAGCFHLTC